MHECPAALTIAAAERALLAAEGTYHAAGVYYASADDAARARRLEAERRVARAARVAAWLEAHPCVWCNKSIGAAPFEMVGAEPMHAERCLAEFDHLAYGAEAA